MFSAYSNGTAGKEPKSLRTKLQTALLFEWQCQAIRRICANVAASRSLCCCHFRGLAILGEQQPWPNGTHPGNGARSSSFPEELFTSGRTQSAPFISARVGVGLGRVRAFTQTRREVWPDMAESITSI